MAKVKGPQPETYLPSSDIQEGGLYLSSAGRAYRVSTIRTDFIECNLVRKTGGTSKFPTRGVYGHTIFFVSVLERPPLPAKPIEAPAILLSGPWTYEGRTLSLHGHPAVTLHRQDALTPVEMDRIGRKITALLNAVAVE